MRIDDLVIDLGLKQDFGLEIGWDRVGPNVLLEITLQGRTRDYPLSLEMTRRIGSRLIEMSEDTEGLTIAPTEENFDPTEGSGT